MIVGNVPWEFRLSTSQRFADVNGFARKTIFFHRAGGVGTFTTTRIVGGRKDRRKTALKMSPVTPACGLVDPVGWALQSDPPSNSEAGGRFRPVPQMEPVGLLKRLSDTTGRSGRPRPPVPDQTRRQAEIGLVPTTGLYHVRPIQP